MPQDGVSAGARPRDGRGVPPEHPDNIASVQDERKLGRLPVLIVRMNADLAMGEALLRKTGSATLFTVFGEPDVRIESTSDGMVVEIVGVDVYNPNDRRDQVERHRRHRDVDGGHGPQRKSFFVRHCYFAGTDGKPDGLDPYRCLKTALKADIDEVAWATLYSTRSRPFPNPESGKIAVKVINHSGGDFSSPVPSGSASCTT